MKKKVKPTEKMEKEGWERRLPPCTYAAEWAEHARFYQEDEPCDDGRRGQVCGSRKDEDNCPV